MPPPSFRPIAVVVAVAACGALPFAGCSDDPAGAPGEGTLDADASGADGMDAAPTDGAPSDAGDAVDPGADGGQDPDGGQDTGAEAVDAPDSGSANTAGLSTMRALAGSSTGISITSIRNSAVRSSPGASSMQPGSSSSSRTVAVPEL